jgi:hypothetical protein
MNNLGSDQRSSRRERSGMITAVIAVMLVVILGAGIYTMMERGAVDTMPSAQTSDGSAPKNPNAAPSAPEKSR